MNTAVLVATTLEEFPPELAGLDYVGIHDPGDEAKYGGLDWTTWLVFFKEVDGREVVAGLRHYLLGAVDASGQGHGLLNRYAVASRP